MSSQEQEENTETAEAEVSTSSDLANVNKDYIPLILPATISKSSKDPHRGLYPRKRRYNEETLSISGPSSSTASFCKASELYKSSRLNAKDSCDNRLNQKPNVHRLNWKPFKPSQEEIFISEATPSTSASCGTAPCSSSSNESHDIEPKRKKFKGKAFVKKSQKNTLHNYYNELCSSQNNVIDISSDDDSSNECLAKIEEKSRYFKSQLKFQSQQNQESNGHEPNLCLPKRRTKLWELNGIQIRAIYPEETANDTFAWNGCNKNKTEVMPEAAVCNNEPSCSKTTTPSLCSFRKEMILETIEDDQSDSIIEIDFSSDGSVDKSSSKMEPVQTPYFGLFGASDKSPADDMGENYFEFLPVGLIEQILCQVPFLDLMTMRSVCKSWNVIISNEKFLEWKKAYYEMKFDRPHKSQCWESALDNGIRAACTENCLTVLIKFMGTCFVRRPPTDIQTFLSHIPKCIDAERVILERFPDLTSQNLSPWSVLTAAVILSERVSDLYEIFRYLIKDCRCNYEDMLEAMFCILTILLHFMRTLQINHGLHYRLYYTLYLLENEMPGGVGSTSVKAEVGMSGQQSLHSYCYPVLPRMTFEQVRILNHRLRPNQVVKVIAFAGSGKTATLIQYARIYSSMKFLNVMFNRAVCDYASKRFPSNVVCKTAHSLAYQAVGKYFRHKLNCKLKPRDVKQYLEKPESVKMHIYTYAKLVLQTIDNFTASADEIITIKHVPLDHDSDFSGGVVLFSDRQPLTEATRLAIAQSALSLWELMTQRNEKCRITHDIYLKMYQLSHPVMLGYDCIMIDEAQDCNAAMLDIMLSQNVPVILVGDPNQQIYGFRGAKNALQNVESTHTYHLTKSFRFGPEIAYVASCCLEILKCNTKSTLIGSQSQSFVDGTVEGQYAIIARTNEKLFSEVVRLCCTSERKPHEPRRIQGAFAGGISGYGLDQIADIYRLKNNETNGFAIKDRFIKKFGSFAELNAYAKNAEDKDMLGKIDLIHHYGDTIIDKIAMIKTKCSYILELANVVFSTAHKSKGLEFDTVALTNDFQIGSVPREKPRKDSSLSEEYNILYVALTRAKKCLITCEKLHHTLVMAQEKFEYPVISSTVLKNELSLKCVSCADTFVPHTALTLVRRAVVLASGRKINGGSLCMKCATNPFYIPEVHYGPAIMQIDCIQDTAHRSMASFVGPLPSDPPITHVQPEGAMNLRENQIFVYMIRRRQR